MTDDELTKLIENLIPFEEFTDAQKVIGLQEEINGLNYCIDERDKEIIIKNETIKFQLNGIKDLNKEIERLKGIIRLEREQNKDNIQKIIKLQSEVKRLK